MICEKFSVLKLDSSLSGDQHEEEIKAYSNQDFLGIPCILFNDQCSIWLFSTSANINTSEKLTPTWLNSAIEKIMYATCVLASCCWQGRHEDNFGYPSRFRLLAWGFKVDSVL